MIQLQIRGNICGSLIYYVKTENASRAKGKFVKDAITTAL